MNALVKLPLEGELLGPDEHLIVLAAMHPLKTGHEPVLVPAGSSVEEIVQRCAEQCRVSRLAGGAKVTIDGLDVPRVWWPRVRVRSGAHVVVRAVPGKGMGNILKSILSFALIAVAGFIVGPAVLGIAGSLAGNLISAGIVLGGNMLLNALFPPSTTKSESSDPVYSIASRQNQSAKWGPIPAVLGRLRVAPKYAASPYTEIVGNDQYLHMLVVWGLGPLKISDIKIGDTPIGEYQDVQVETFEGYSTDGKPTLYPSTVIQDDFQIEPEQNKPNVRTGADEAVALSLDFMAPQGIGNIEKQSGKLGSFTVELRVEVINGVTGATAYNQVLAIKGKTRDPLRQSLRIDLPKGRYNTRVTRLSGDDTGDDHLEQVIWSALRSYRAEPAIQYKKPVAVTAIRIRATKQLNGAISDLSGIASAVARSYVGGQWNDNRETRNPADLFRLVLQGPGNARPRTNQNVDLSTVEAWGELCRLKGWTFDMNRDFASTVRETLRDICAAGRAVPIFRDGKWSVAMEDVAAPLVQVFTPRNVRNFTRSITYTELPHALRVKFVNETKDWIEDELLVYAEGYDRFSATLFEMIELPGVTHPDNIFKHAKYREAEAKLRPSVYRFTTDAEHLICTRGDRVKISHFVVRRGAIQGRVIGVGGQVVMLDEPITMVAGKAYAMDIRRKNGAVVTLPVTTQAGTGNDVTVTGTPPAIGDLVAVGEASQVSLNCKILRIKPGANFSAQIEAVDDALEIQNADTGPIGGGGGTVNQPVPVASYRPRGLRFDSFTEDRALGTVFVGRLFWTMVPPPNMNIVSFLVVAINSDGNERRTFVDPQTLHVQFEDLADGEWTFRVHAYFEGGKISNASDPLTVGINIPRDQLGVGLGNVMPDLRSVLEFGPESVSRFSTLLEELAANTAAANVVLKKESSASRALIIEERTVRADETGALAKKVDGVIAELGDNGFAAAIDSLEAKVDNQGGLLTASAERLNGVEARANEATATGLSRMEVVAGPAGVSARFAQVLRVSQGSSFRDAGFYMDVRDDGVASAGFDVQRFFLTDSTNKTNPFRFENGVLYANAALLGSLIVEGTITGAKLSAQTIDTIHLKARSVSTDQITIGGVTTDILSLQAASTSAIAERADDFNLPAYWYDHLAVALNMTVAGVIHVFAQVRAATTNNPDDLSADASMRISMNGSVFWEGTPTSFKNFALGVGAGYYTFMIQMKNNNGSTRHRGTRISLLGSKR